MRNQGKHIQAMTLTELLVVISVMAIMLAVAAPVAKKLSESLGESTGVKSIIGAAMSNARAIAVREQKYVGVRVQQDNSGKQFLILIIHEPDSNFAAGLENKFCAIPGKKPMVLPDDLRVISCRVQKTYDATKTGSDTIYADLDLADPSAIADTRLNSQPGKNDTSTFSIVFNPSGKYVVHPVCVYNNGANDTMFNTKAKVAAGTAKFRQDEHETAEHDGFQEENSVGSFKIYSNKALEKAPVSQPWSGYLAGLDKAFVNPYTGELIKKN